jgi:hypothetical protein
MNNQVHQCDLPHTFSLGIYENYTQWVSLSDMDRNSNIYSNPPIAGHNRIITETIIEGSEDCTQGNIQLKLLITVGT